MVLLQRLLVTLSKRSAQLRCWIVNVMSQSSCSELESTEQPHQTLSGLSVFGVLVCSLLGGKKGFERLAGLWVAGEVRSDLLWVTIGGWE